MGWWLEAVEFSMSDATLLSHLRSVDGIVTSGGSLPVLSDFLFGLRNGGLAVATSSTRAHLIASISIVGTRKDKLFTISTGVLLSPLGRLPRRPLAFSVGSSGLRVFVRFRGNGCGFVKRGKSACPRRGPLGRGTVSVVVSTRVLLGNVDHSLFTATSSRLHPMVGNVCFSVRASSLAFITSSNRGLIHLHGLSMGSPRETSFVLPGGPTGLLGNLLSGRKRVIDVGFSSGGTCVGYTGFRVMYHLVRNHCPGCGDIVPRRGPFGIAVSHVSFLGTLGHISIFSGPTDDLIGLRLGRGRVLISTRSVSFSASTRRGVIYDFSKARLDVNFGTACLVRVLDGVGSRRIVLRLTSPSHTNLVIPSRGRRGRSLLVLLVPVVLGSWGVEGTIGPRGSIDLLQLKSSKCWCYREPCHKGLFYRNLPR